MSRIHHLIGRAQGAVGVVLGSLVLAPAVAVAVVEAPLLTLDPTAGAPGTQVTWSVSGFGDCTPVDDADPVAVVALYWDGEDEIDRTSLDDGFATSTFLVPESAALGPHRVLARCTSDAAPSDGDDFAVTAPEVEPVVVPNVVGQSLGDAESALEGAGLRRGDVTGDRSTVVDQEPPAGREVDPGTAVDLDTGAALPDLVTVPDVVDGFVSEARAELEAVGLELGAVTGPSGGRVQRQVPPAGTQVVAGRAVDVVVGESPTELVTVPDVRGLDLAKVPAALDARGLELGLVTGDGEVVRGQRPVAGQRVPAGSEVNVSVEPDVVPVSVVAVPDVVGMTSDDAGAALEAAGLVLGGAVEADREVTSQQPVAGARVSVGSTVTVAYAPEPDPSGWTWSTVAALGAGACVVVVGAAAGRRALKPRTDRGWVADHLALVPEQVPPTPSVAEPATDSSAPSLVVRLTPHPDPGTQTVQEDLP